MADGGNTNTAVYFQDATFEFAAGAPPFLLMLGRFVSGLIVAGTVKDLIAPVHVQTDGAQFTAASLAVVRLEQTGDPDDGKYWTDDAGGSWEVLGDFPGTVATPAGAHQQAGLHLYQLPAAATTGRTGARIHFTFTDDEDEAAATTVCAGGEMKVEVSFSVWDAPNTGADHNIKNSTGKQQRQASGGFEEKDVVSATASAIVLDASESALDDFLTHRYVAITAGTGVGQIRVIDDYDGSTKTATVARPFDPIPDATSDYILLLSSESEPLRSIETEAAVGSTLTEIRTGLTQADDFFNNMQVVIINAAGTIVRNIDDYANTNGAITVGALPFTPAVGDPVYILRRLGSSAVMTITQQQVRDAMKLSPTAGAFGAGSLDESHQILRGLKLHYRIDKIIRDPTSGFMLSARLRVFPDQATADLSTKDNDGLQGAIDSATITGTANGVFVLLPADVVAGV